MSTTMTLAWGYNPGLPPGVRAAWGARLIWPDQLLWDRQDLVADDDAEKKALLRWLNGPEGQEGAVSKMRFMMHDQPVRDRLGGPAGEQATELYRDDVGVIVGSARGSHGYLYVAAWLHEHAVALDTPGEGVAR